MKKEIPLTKAYRLINHGPTVLVTSSYKKRANIQTASWISPIDIEPPHLAVVVGSDNLSYLQIQQTGEFVINIPNLSLLEKVVQCGKTSGETVDKFEKLGLTPIPAKKVRAPLIKECIGHLECKVVEEESMVSKYDLFIGEVKVAWVESEAFDEHWLVDKEIGKTIHHLGSGFYTFPSNVVEQK